MNPLRWNLAQWAFAVVTLYCMGDCIIVWICVTL